MFDRIQYESWQIVFPIGGFLLLLGIFTLMVIRVSRLPKSRVKHLANLPFDEKGGEEKDEPTGPEQR